MQLTITYSVLISPCFALDPYKKQLLIKPEWVINRVLRLSYKTDLVIKHLKDLVYTFGQEYLN